VSPEGYEVGDDVAGALRDRLGTGDGWLAPSGAGRWRVDLPAANRAALVAAGVPAGNVLVSPWRTGGGGPFFSHREADPCGRFGLLARLLWDAYGDVTSAPLTEAFVATRGVAEQLFSTYLLPFEIIALLLLVAVVAASWVARRPDETDEKESGS